MKKITPRLYLIGLSLTMVPIACTIFVGGPDYPSPAIMTSTEAVGNLELQVQSAQTLAAQTGTITLTVNETQITSLLMAKLDAQGESFLQAPQVYFRNGQIHVYGKATQSNLQANFRVILSASIDSEGQPLLTVTSADFGPFPTPVELNKTISTLIEQAFTGSIGPAATGLRLQTINIQDGTLTITGQVK